MKKIFVTTSWDDGHKLDLKVSELLTKYGLTGTFYIAINQNNRLSDADIREISKNHEIGAHTVNHPRLSAVGLNKAAEEIKNSKTILENIVGKPVEMFAYPFGDYNEEIKRIVSSLGFVGARTVRDWVIEAPGDFFEMGTTIHIYPHPWRPNTGSVRASLRPFFGNIGGIIKKKISPKALFFWQPLARGLFDYVYENGGVFHIWGHSWEIEQYKMWDKLEDLLKYISSKEGVEFKTNGEII